MVQLFLHGAVLGCSLVELALESDRGVVSTENLRAKALHVRLQVLVQIAGLDKADTNIQHQCIHHKKILNTDVDTIK